MQDPNKFHELEKILAPYNLIMCKAADTILDEEVSSYPIFVIPDKAVALGIPLVEGEGQQEVRIHATTLEELATKNIIAPDKVDRFRQIYKDPGLYLCLFVVDDQQADFVFLPRIQADN